MIWLVIMHVKESIWLMDKNKKFREL